MDTADPFSAIVGVTITSTSATTKVAPSVTTDAADSLLLTPSYNVLANAFGAGDGGGAPAYQVQPVAGASTTATWTTAGSNTGISWQTALNPSAVAAFGRAVEIRNGSALIRRSVDRWNGTALVPQTPHL